MVDENNEVDGKKDIPLSNRRPFATGSKPGPDELDHHLESKGFYRKHIARDASSLFRVVSEQVFDVQNYHDKVRQDLASFIEQNFKDYVQEVDKNIYNYCTLLRRARTYGTLFDLKVLARMYNKNVILYEPTKNLQTSERFFIQNDLYNNVPPMRVFYSEQDKHFDIIFTLEYTEKLAESQGIVYEILYKSVFKLPDVAYAVERMLHDPEGVTTTILSDDSSKYANAAGEIIAFDEADETECVLKDPRTCHFHNQDDFEEVIEEQKDVVTIINRSDEPGRLKIYKLIDGFLHSKDKSCVRQLLEEKITPFPYKVAKALDRSIYRNTEFELWSENRKDQRLKWLDSNGLPIRDHDDLFMHLRENTSEKKTTHTQITRDTLDEILNLNRNIEGKRSFQYSLEGITNLDDLKTPQSPHIESTYAVYPVQYTNNYKKFNISNRRRGGGFHQNFGQNRYSSYNQQDQQQQHHPQNHNYVHEIHHRENFYQEQESQQSVYMPQPQVYVDSSSYQYIPFEQLSPTSYHGGNGATHYIAVQPNPYPHSLQNPMPIQGLTPNSNFSVPPTLIQQNPILHQAIPINNNDSLNLIRENELNSNINQAQQESVDPRGTDMPLNDIPTLQFFFNLGVRYFLQHNESVRNRLEGVVNQLENLNVNNPTLDNDRNEMNTKNELPPPVPANTPVSSKLIQQQHVTVSTSGGGGGNGKLVSHCAASNRFSINNNNRRQYNNQNRDVRDNNFRENQCSRDSNWRENRNRNTQTNSNQGNNVITRRESGIQFNSNVKNLHKIDSDSKSFSASVQQQTVSSSSSQNSAQLTAQVSSQNLAQISPAISGNNNSAISGTAGVSPSGASSDNLSLDQNQWQSQQPQQITVQQQYYPYQPASNYIAQSGQTALYYYNENGTLCSYQAASQAPMQQIYYSYPQQASVYYQPAQQIHPNQAYDDSGHVDASLQNYSAYPVYYAQPPPVYYPPTPATATPHIMTTAPIFPVAPNQASLSSMPPTLIENNNTVENITHDHQISQNAELLVSNNIEQNRNEESDTVIKNTVSQTSKN